MRIIDTFIDLTGSWLSAIERIFDIELSAC